MEDKSPDWLDQAIKLSREIMDRTAKSIDENMARVSREINAELTRRRRQDRINNLVEEKIDNSPDSGGPIIIKGEEDENIIYQRYPQQT